MIAYVVTEGPLDVELLRRVAPEDLREGVKFVDGGRLYAAISLARSLIVRRQTPVAIVVDAGAVSQEFVRERRRSIEESIEYVAGNVPFKVILAVPEMEAIFFEDTAPLERVFGHSIPESVRMRADARPREALEQLLRQSTHIRTREELVSALTADDVRILQKAALIQELVDFLRHAHALAVAGVIVRG